MDTDRTPQQQHIRDHFNEQVWRIISGSKYNALKLQNYRKIDKNKHWEEIK